MFIFTEKQNMMQGFIFPCKAGFFHIACPDLSEKPDPSDSAQQAND